MSVRCDDPGGGEQPEPRSRLAELADRFIQLLEHAKEQADDPAWGYLLEHMDGYTGAWLAVGIALSKRADQPVDEQMAEIFEPGITEPELLRRVREHLEAAPISWERRDQFNAGISYVANGKYHLAVPMFLSPLEGAFWRAAEEQELVEQREGKWFRKGTRRPIAITEVFELEDIDLDEKFAGFARAFVYGCSGNQFRHGTAEGEWRFRALFLLASLIEWLDLHDLMDAKAELKAAFIRASEARRS